MNYNDMKTCVHAYMCLYIACASLNTSGCVFLTSELFLGLCGVGLLEQLQGGVYAPTGLYLQLVRLVPEHQVPEGCRGALADSWVGTAQEGNQGGYSAKLEHLGRGRGETESIFKGLAGVLLPFA